MLKGRGLLACHLSAKYSNVRKELAEIMGGKILEYKGERIFNEGKEEGWIENLPDLAHDNTLPVDVAASKAEKKYNVPKNEFLEMLKSYKPDDELKQG